MIDGPGTFLLSEGCFVDGATAYELSQVIKVAESTARANGVHLTPRLAAAGRNFATLGERWLTEQRQAYRDRNVGIPTEGDSVMVDLVDTVGSREAGRIIGISPRAVIARAARGTLAGRKLASGEWLFPLTVVADAAKARKDSNAA